MINIDKYDRKFEEFYYGIVKEKVSASLKKYIIESCISYFPNDFFKNLNNLDEKFKKLILADYSQLKIIYEHINSNYAQFNSVVFNNIDGKKVRKGNYDDYFKTYDKVRDSTCTLKMNVRIVKESRMHVCPYCNREYINSRDNKVSGAQLDHFFSRSNYPIFSLSLYNLVPVCANCNRVKSSADDDGMVSPFDSNVNFFHDIKFSYEFDSDLNIKLRINNKKNIKNIQVLKIDKAYEINSLDVEELLNKNRKYSESQLEEIIKNLDICSKDIKEMIFVKEIKCDDFGKKPLSKLRYDIIEELGVFK